MSAVTRYNNAADKLARAHYVLALEAERDALRDERDLCFDTLVKMRDSRDALLSDVKRLEYAIREADSWRARYANIALKLDTLTAERDRYREIVQEAATFPCRASDPPCSEIWPSEPERWCLTCRALVALEKGAEP